eukprot:14212629-Heterocapsa_arctica.AAC.1
MVPSPASDDAGDPAASRRGRGLCRRFNGAATRRFRLRARGTTGPPAAGATPGSSPGRSAPAGAAAGRTRSAGMPAGT